MSNIMTPSNPNNHAGFVGFSDPQKQKLAYEVYAVVRKALRAKRTRYWRDQDNKPCKEELPDYQTRLRAAELGARLSLPQQVKLESSLANAQGLEVIVLDLNGQQLRERHLIEVNGPNTDDPSQDDPNQDQSAISSNPISSSPVSIPPISTNSVSSTPDGSPTDGDSTHSKDD